jgi:hypothetical protein
MTAEQLVRDQLDRATREVPSSPDLETAVRRGRRRRRQRRGGMALAAVAVLGLGATGLQMATDDSGRTVVRDTPVAAAPAPSAPDDFVAGTGTDEALVAVLAERLPTLPTPDDVYPSDRHTAGPMPDAEFAAAEDWQAAYTLGANQRFLLMTAHPSEGPFSCQACQPEAVPGGTIFRQESTSGGGTWQFATWFVRDDGSVVGAFEYVDHVGSEDPARVLSQAELENLVQDPRLVFDALTAAG